MYSVYRVKKDEYKEQQTQSIRENVYTVREKIGYLIVRKNHYQFFY